jgi:uncharacterized protein YbjT (DUF2867 family)
VRVLLAGATGETGIEFIRSLRGAGHEVLALVRPTSRGKLAAVADQLAGLREGDVTLPPTLAGSCDGCDVVITTITRTHPKQRHREVDFEGNASLLREALRTGVRRFIYISSLGAGSVPGVPVLEQKGRFEECLRSSPISSLIVRPSALFQDMERIFDSAGGGKVMLFGNGQQRVTPMAESDLADYVTARLEGPAGTVEVGGPRTYTMDEVGRLALAARGNRDGTIRHVPLWTFSGFVRVAKVLLPDAYPVLRFVEHVFGSSNAAPEVGISTLEDYFRALAGRVPGTQGGPAPARLFRR